MTLPLQPVRVRSNGKRDCDPVPGAISMARYLPFVARAFGVGAFIVIVAIVCLTASPAPGTARASPVGEPQHLHSPAHCRGRTSPIDLTGLSTSTTGNPNCRKHRPLHLVSVHSSTLCKTVCLACQAAFGGWVRAALKMGVTDCARALLSFSEGLLCQTQHSRYRRLKPSRIGGQTTDRAL